MTIRNIDGVIIGRDEIDYAARSAAVAQASELLLPLHPESRAAVIVALAISFRIEPDVFRQMPSMAYVKTMHDGFVLHGPGWTDTPTQGAELRAARVSKGLSLREVADAVGISHTHLADIERGMSSALRDRVVDFIERTPTKEQP